MRIGSNILRYEDGQYSVNTGMGIFYTHIFVNLYVRKKKKRIFGKILDLVMMLKSGMDEGHPDMGSLYSPGYVGGRFGLRD